MRHSHGEPSCQCLWDWPLTQRRQQPPSAHAAAAVEEELKSVVAERLDQEVTQPLGRLITPLQGLISGEIGRLVVPLLWALDMNAESAIAGGSGSHCVFFRMCFHSNLPFCYSFIFQMYVSISANCKDVYLVQALLENCVRETGDSCHTFYSRKYFSAQVCYTKSSKFLCKHKLYLIYKKLSPLWNRHCLQLIKYVDIFFGPFFHNGTYCT